LIYAAIRGDHAFPTAATPKTFHVMPSSCVTLPARSYDGRGGGRPLVST
jgi:hypothetical protein